jgi:hypothetical protein
MPSPPGWQTVDGFVEMILPYDVSTVDPHGRYNYGIPDLTLAFLLYRLSQAKGNNIVSNRLYISLHRLTMAIRL